MPTPVRRITQQGRRPGGRKVIGAIRTPTTSRARVVAAGIARLRPPGDGFDQRADSLAPEAHRRIEAREHRGMVVLTP
ncbi:hypothetical protein ACTD5D_25385 [Nocardia takedensis]|uniref:hypothetical protein n=1 Tax=Nocardia takedensis TaxID=259390 RepID=UPI0002F172C4|nr:hypothetical protein [Nocardia takedensis]